MINPKQLRLGNYIQDRGGKVLRIDFMKHVQEGYDTKVGQLMHIEGEEVHPMTEYSDYANPIQLTEEWLLRLGFEKEDDVFYKIKDSEGWLLTNDGELTKSISEFYICVRFVHQLQNLYFALTGEELKLDTMS